MSCPFKIQMLFILSLFSFVTSYTQTVAINNTGSAPNAAAILDIDGSGSSTKKGLLIPRLTLAERNAMNPLPSAAQGLVVYQTDGIQGFYFNKSATTVPVWAFLSSGSNSGWSITGNSGTVDGTHFIGTTDNVPLNFRVNNSPAGRIESGFGNSGMTVIGFEAGGAISNSIATAFGYKALHNNIAAQGNTAVGWNALYSNVGASFNTAVGAGALYSNTNGTNNTAVGYNALYFNNNNASFNTAIGYNTLLKNIGEENSALGSSSLDNNTTGSQNTALGFQSLHNNTTGNYNTANGLNALIYNTTGSYNVAVGALAGGNPSNTTGNYNIFIGYNAGAVGSLQNAIAIGKNALVTQNNSMVLGGTGVDAISAGIGTGSPTSTLHVEGSLSTAMSNTSGDFTLTGIHHTLIITGAGGYTISLPAANSCVGRIYVILNRATSACSTNLSFITPAGTASSNITPNNSIWIQSDGTQWQQIK